MDLATQLHDYDNTNYNEHKTNKLTTPVVSKKTIVLQDATIESALYVHHKTHTLLEFLSMNSIIWCKKWLTKNSNEDQLGAFSTRKYK
jgi:hypothetical protein